MNDSYYVYVVDDNKTVLAVLKKLIRTEFDINIRTFNTAEDCMLMISKREPDFVISNNNLNPLAEKNKMNGQDLLNLLKQEYPSIKVIMYSTSHELNTIIDLLKSGAFDFVCMGHLFEKKFITILGKALKKAHQEREFVLTKRGILNFIGLILAINLIIFFIDSEFFLYLLICLLSPLFFIFTLAYYKYFFRKNTHRIRFKGFPFVRRKKEFTIFVVDDSEIYRLMITDVLDKERKYFHPDDYIIKTFASAKKCLKEISSQPDILILDYLLEDSDDQIKNMNGLKMLEEVKRLSPNTKVIMLSNQKDTNIVSELFREGAQDYILKDRLWQYKIRNITHRLLKLQKDRKRSLIRWWNKSKLKPMA